MRIVAIVKERKAKQKKHKHGVGLRAYYGLGFRIQFQGLGFNTVFDGRCWVQGSFPVLLRALCLLKEASGLHPKLRRSDPTSGAPGFRVYDLGV